jgi:hypothetical protein
MDSIDFILMWIVVPLYGALNGLVLVNEFIIRVMRMHWLAVLIGVVLASNSTMLYVLACEHNHFALAWYVQIVCATAVCLRYWHVLTSGSLHAFVDHEQPLHPDDVILLRHILGIWQSKQ